MAEEQEGKAMTDFAELLGVNAEEAFKFFLQHLNDTIVQMPEAKAGPNKLRVNLDELKHAASVLAHYAITSTSDGDTPHIGTPRSFMDVFDNFVYRGPANYTDSELMELAGSQTLLWAGFFRDQVGARHNVEWYDRLGQDFYSCASRHAPSSNMKRKECLRRMSVNFSLWAKCFQKLSRFLRDKPYLLKP